jgi:hypothetical protein
LRLPDLRKLQSREAFERDILRPEVVDAALKRAVQRLTPSAEAAQRQFGEQASARTA